MIKPKSFDSWTPEKQAEWMARYKSMRREQERRRRARNPKRCQEITKASEAKRPEHYAEQKRQRARKAYPTYKNVRNSKKAIGRQIISDSHLAGCKGMTVKQLREYPQPVIDLWKSLLKLSRLRKQINNRINESETER